jgi:PAS domain S-box-containing protein
VNDAIFLCDVNNDEILDANDRALQLLGYSREELLQTPVSDIHPHEVLQLKSFSDKVFQDKRGWTDELSCLTKGGKILPAEISATIVEFEGRECLVASIRDVSDKAKLGQENGYLKQQLNIEAGFDRIVGDSDALNKMLQQVSLVAQTDASVLICGETGTGKEMIAHAIHQQSKRADNTLVRVNCASIPNELFESEFFGHVKGAFTGAVQNRVGRFELADGGTLFLDEVSEIPLALQGKLLRVLQENQFERVGESQVRRSNVRIVAATNRDLLEEAKQKRFRADLYYRLSVFPIEAPPLRERAPDIPLLIEHFVSKVCKKYGLVVPSIAQSEIDALSRQHWPGNIRELQNEIERAVIHAGGKQLKFSNQPLAVAYTKPQEDEGSQTTESLTLADLVSMEADIIQRELRKSRGRIYGTDGAAESLGIPPTTLNYRIKKLGISKYPE